MSECCTTPIYVDRVNLLVCFYVYSLIISVIHQHCVIRVTNLFCFVHACVFVCECVYMYIREYVCMYI